MAEAQVLKLDRDQWRYKMKDLCDASGLPRQAIHFYIQQGLLPAGRKTGRNMAWYSEEHLKRLEWIKKLQHERFLPLKAIKALLDGQEEIFSPEQHSFLTSVKERLGSDFKPTIDRAETVDVEEILAQGGVDRADLDRALELGLIASTTDDAGRLRIAAADVWMFEMLGDGRKLGFTRERGFTVDVLAFFEEQVTRIVQEEVHLLASRLQELPPEEVAQMMERVLPLIHNCLIRLHSTKVREFFGDVI